MEENGTEQRDEAQHLMETYWKALDENDLRQCVDAYEEDGEIHFMNGVHKGKKAIEEWHKERFAAEAKIIQVGKVTVKGEKFEVKGTVTSKKLKAWKINKLAGKATFYIHQGKIRKVTLSPRLYNPLQGW